MTRRWQHLDLLASVALTLLTAVLVIAFPAWRSPLRTFLGFTVVLLLPGYVLQALLFPRKGDVDGIERVALMLGLSIVVLPLLGLFLNYTPWGIHTGSIALGLAIVVAALALASYARRRWSAGEAFYLDLRETEVRRGVVIFALVTAVVGGVPSLAVALRPAPNDTEFYVLGSHGRLEDYPRTLAPGETFRLTFGVTNRGPGPQSYTIRFPFEPKARFVLVPMLKPGDTWQTPVTLTAPDGSGRTELDFGLYRTGSGDRYRHLKLFVDIEPAGASAASGGRTSAAPPTGAPLKPAGATQPAGTVAAVQAKGYLSYRVRPGDTMYSIAQHLYGNGNAYPRIVAANQGRLANFRQLPVGLTLRIPPP